MVSGLEDVRMGGVRLGVLETIEELIKLCKLETMRSPIKVVGTKIGKC